MWYTVVMMDFQSFLALCKKRRSIHAFESSLVSRATIDELLTVTTLAPSVGNTQPWHFHVILNEELLQKLVESCCYGNFVAGAGAFIIVACDSAKRPLDGKVLWNPRELEYSCAGAMAHLLLGATAMGIGSCWVSLHHGPSHDLLHLPSTHRIVGAVMLGKVTPASAEIPHDRHALTTCVTYHE